MSEYGVHWNFFITLAFLGLATSLLQSLFSHSTLAVLGTLIMIIYQCALSFTGLQDYLFSETRVTLVDQNKEGLFSLIGTVA